MSRRSTALAGLVAVAALTLAACSGTDSTTAAPTAQTRAEDELVLAVGDVGEGEFDPLRGWGNHQEHKVLHSSLVQWNRSAETGEMELVGDLARDFSHKGTVWTFHLREDFMFSDGEPVTAADVVFTYDLLKEDGTQFDLTNVAEVRAVDERTVEIELVQPDSLFGPQAATIAILPEHAYGEGYSQNPIASGPYRVVEYQDGEQLSMEAILQADPDFIFVVEQSADPAVAKAVLEETLFSNPAWQTLTAVREDRVHVMDSALYNLKPNARWGEAYEKLADILYGQQ